MQGLGFLQQLLPMIMQTVQTAANPDDLNPDGTDAFGQNTAPARPSAGGMPDPGVPDPVHTNLPGAVSPTELAAVSPTEIVGPTDVLDEDLLRMLLGMAG